MFNNSNYKKIINKVLAAMLTLTTFSSASKCQSISEAEAMELANLVYERAQEVWEQAEKEAKEKGITLTCKNCLDVETIMDQYCLFNSDVPKTVDHATFEELKTNKIVLYRGFAAPSENLANQWSINTKTGVYKQGEEHNGLFCSIYKKQSDCPEDGSPLDMAAESYTDSDSHKRIISFFCNPEKVRIGHGIDRIIETYEEMCSYSKKVVNSRMALTDSELESLTDRDRFLYLITFGCPATKYFAQLLGYDAIESYDWQYQIFNPGILIFDEQDEIIK